MFTCNTRALQSTYPVHCSCILSICIETIWIRLACMSTHLPSHCPLYVVRMSRKYVVNCRCGWSTQSEIFVAILARVVDLKQNQAIFSPHLTVWLCLQLAQMSISRDLAIFVLNPHACPLGYVIITMQGTSSRKIHPAIILYQHQS